MPFLLKMLFSNVPRHASAIEVLFNHMLSRRSIENWGETLQMVAVLWSLDPESCRKQSKKRGTISSSQQQYMRLRTQSFSYIQYVDTLTRSHTLSLARSALDEHNDVANINAKSSTLLVTVCEKAFPESGKATVVHYWDGTFLELEHMECCEGKIWLNSCRESFIKMLSDKQMRETEEDKAKAQISHSQPDDLIDFYHLKSRKRGIRSTLANWKIQFSELTANAGTISDRQMMHANYIVQR
ncbi:Coatomer subunit beta-2, partial [Sesamum angolense]